MNVAWMAQRRLAQMAGLELGWRLHLGELLAWVVAGLALLMSYHAELDLGQSLRAFEGWPAWVWPLSVDFADVCLMVLYLEYKRLRLSTWKVGLGMVAATAVMIAANVRSAWPDPTAVAMQAWVPGIALWLWHTLAAGRKPRGAPIDLGSVWTRFTGGAVESHGEPDALPADTFDQESGDGSRTADRTDAADHRRSESDVEPGDQRAEDVQEDVRNPQPHQPARVEVRRMLQRHRGALAEAELRRLAMRVHERTGVSIPRARRLIREEQRLRLVTDESPRTRPGAEAER